MSYGLQISASGAFGAMYRQDVFANNLANMDTVGFKPEVPSPLARQAVTKEDHVGYLPSNALLERLGGGLLMNPNRLKLEQGSLRTTGRDLDVAIEGTGFLTVKDPEAKGAGDALLTRDGRLARNAQGLLVMATTGLPLMDAQNRPIEIADNGKVLIGQDGIVRQNGVEMGRLNLVEVPDPGTMERRGSNLYRPNPDQLKRKSASMAEIRSGHVEESVVDEVKALMDVTSAARDVDANIAMIQQHDRLMERAIQSLGRTA
ncbi:MAG: flagellar hook-basal body protein [Phycisphaerales bacterium]